MPAVVITVAQQKGGCGKSTVSTHLAVAFAQMGYSTMLFDTDPQGTTSHWHAERKNDDISLLATSGWRLTRDLAMAREANDVIIIDTPPHAEMDIKVSTRAADLVLVPAQPSPADLWALKETYNTVAGEGRQAMVVLNRVVPRANITQEVREKLAAMDIPVAETEIGNRVLFAASMESGQTVLDGFSNPSETEIMALVKEIAAKVGIAVKPATKAKPAAKKAVKKTKAAPAKKPAVKKASAKKAAVKKAPAKKAAVKTKAAPKKAAVKKAAVKKPAVKKVAKKAAPKKAAKKAA